MSVQLCEELRSTDKLCDQWSRERRDTPPAIKCTLHNMALLKAGVVLEGPFEMSEASLMVDRIYLSSPIREKAILEVWYGHGGSSQQKAKKLGISRASIYTYWRNCLWYVRGRLHTFGLDF